LGQRKERSEKRRENGEKKARKSEARGREVERERQGEEARVKRGRRKEKNSLIFFISIKSTFIRIQFMLK